MYSILFGVFPFSFGAPLIPVGSLMNIITLAPGTNTLCIPYAPNFSGHTCVQAIIRCPGFEPQITQRNLEYTELIPIRIRRVPSISTLTPQIHQVKLVTSDWFDDFCFAPRAGATGPVLPRERDRLHASDAALGQHAWPALVVWALQGML